MSDVIDHLRDALDELRSAKAEANMGTSLMIGDIIERLQGLIERTENINDTTTDGE